MILELSSNPDDCARPSSSLTHGALPQAPAHGPNLQPGPQASPPRPRLPSQLQPQAPAPFPGPNGAQDPAQARSPAHPRAELRPVPSLSSAAAAGWGPPWPRGAPPPPPPPPGPPPRSRHRPSPPPSRSRHRLPLRRFRRNFPSCRSSTTSSNGNGLRGAGDGEPRVGSGAVGCPLFKEPSRSPQCLPCSLPPGWGCGKGGTPVPGAVWVTEVVPGC